MFCHSLCILSPLVLWYEKKKRITHKRKGEYFGESQAERLHSISLRSKVTRREALCRRVSDYPAWAISSCDYNWCMPGKIAGLGHLLHCHLGNTISSSNWCLNMFILTLCGYLVALTNVTGKLPHWKIAGAVKREKAFVWRAMYFPSSRHPPHVRMYSKRWPDWSYRGHCFQYSSSFWCQA